MIQTDRGHFWITFDNGYTVSIFNGFGSYSENYLKKDILESNFMPIHSRDCEVAIIYKPSGEFATKQFIETAGDDVIGNVSVDELVEIINKVKNYEVK